MKIAVWHNLPSGGGSRALHYHIKGLYLQGHSIELWTNPLADNEFLNVDAFVQKIHIVPLDVNQSSTFLEKIGYVFFKNDRNIQAMEKHCKQCAEAIDADNFDVLFANSCQNFAVPFIARFIEKIPTVLYLGEPMRHLYEALPTLIWAGIEPLVFWRRSHWKTFWLDLWRTRSARVQAREERANYLAFNKVLVNSYYSSEACVRVFGKAPEVCYLGIDTNLFQNKTIEREGFVLGIGNFFLNKNPALAVKAIAEIASEKRPALIWAANMKNHEYVAEVSTLARQLGVNFVLKENVSNQDLVLLLNQAKVFVYTSRLEPFGFAPLEANACGLPVVAVAEGGVRETIIDENNGLLVEANAKKIANAIEILMKNQTLWQQYSQRAEHWVHKHWLLEQGTRRIEEKLQELC